MRGKRTAGSAPARGTGANDVAGFGAAVTFALDDDDGVCRVAVVVAAAFVVAPAFVDAAAVVREGPAVVVVLGLDGTIGVVG